MAPVSLHISSDASGGQMLIANIGVKFKIPSSAAAGQADNGRLSKDALCVDPHVPLAPSGLESDFTAFISQGEGWRFH